MIIQQKKEKEYAGTPLPTAPVPLQGWQLRVLLISALLVSVCALTYELLIGSLSSYLLGDSVLYFSLTIGIFMTAMGIGSYLSKTVRRNLLRVFLLTELGISILGGFSVIILYGVLLTTRSYPLVMVLLIACIGTLIGLEVPLLTRIARAYGSLKDILAQVLSFDYLGALAASIVFPLFLLPHLGLIKTSLLVGMLNLLVVVLGLSVFNRSVPGLRTLICLAGIAGVTLSGGLVYAVQINSFFENHLYRDEIIYSKQTPYQKIVMTSFRGDLRLYLDGGLQFSSVDEYRYHEALVHPVMGLAPHPEQVLIIGGGDGLAAREVLRYPQVQALTLVDIDPAMTAMASTFGPVVALNGGALHDSRVHVLNQDAFTFLDNTATLYNVVILDLPDPRSQALAKLYTREMYRLVGRHLAVGGVVAVQSGSPYFARKAFWCVVHTARAAGLETLPYHAYVPSFGDWGYTLLARHPLDPAQVQLLPQAPRRYLTPSLLSALFIFDPDSADLQVQVNSLDNEVILEYDIQGWDRGRFA